MRTASWIVSVALLSACATAPTIALHASQSSANPKLADVADRFYLATTAQQMKAAVDEALALAPAAAVSHELAAQYALLTGDEHAATAHLINALTDTDNADALLHLKLLFGTEWSADESQKIEALLAALTESHPSPEVRAYAAFRLSSLRKELGQSNAADAEARINGRLPLAVIGPWDNDQGKGFDLVQPPETDGVDFNAEYPGMLRPIRWRAELPVGIAGVYHLSEAVEPSRFALAYATGAFKLNAPGRVELRLRTTEPFKLWVDGAQVMSVREVREYMFDQAVIPLELPAGEHRILIKSARREEGQWLLSARITGERGAELASFEPLLPSASVTPQKLVAKELNEDVFVRSRLVNLTDKRARSTALTALWWKHASGGAAAVRHAEEYAGAAPDSIYARWVLALSLWSNSEHGRASDILSPLANSVGAELPAVAAAQARLWTQQGLRQKARTALVALKTKHATNPAVLRELENVYDAEDWVEDECSVRAELNAYFAGNASSLSRHASCLQRLGHFEEAEAAFIHQLKITPGDPYLLHAYMTFALERGREPTAEWAAREYVERYPYFRGGHLSLAGILERREAYDEAKQSLANAMALAPESATPWSTLARMEYRRGKKDEAVRAWREALARNPDDEKLANRVDFLSPEAAPIWASDVPDELELEKLVQKARALKGSPGANYAYVLDHEVAEYKPDGTVVALVTEVLQSFNAEGRDALLKRQLGGGRVRMRHAYAVDADGRRIEPASVRDGVVRFRSLGERSTVVLQFRRDTSPRGYLARQLSYTWNFQGLSEQRERAQFILYLPKTVNLHEWLRGKVERTEKEVGAYRRLQWLAENVQPAGYELGMPPVSEVTSTLQLSSIESWDVFAKWTQALFEDAMRESPELKALAAKLFEGTEDPNEKLLRIQAYLMKEIRYEQDYESMIAGVKPHPAPMVIERKYGDCKDKTVLFMTLARMAGIETHYALIRTRDWGAVRTELPQQQFNHVIVYVPTQPGIEKDRYFDPTADALDLVTLRGDVVGTKSFVLNPKDRSWSFRQVPFQTLDANAFHATVDVSLEQDGSGTALLRETMVGNDASSVRRYARNKEQFERLLQHFATNMFAGSEIKAKTELPNPDDVRSPATFALELVARTAAKKEGDTLRLSLPRDITPLQYFKLSQRKHPLVLTYPRRFRWSGTVKLPNASVARAPEAVQFQSPCFDYTRKVVPTADGVQYDHAADFKCERIEPSSYAEALKAAVEVNRLMEEDVVFSVGKKPAAPKLKTVTRPVP